MLWSPRWEWTADRLSPINCEERLSVPLPWLHSHSSTITSSSSQRSVHLRLWRCDLVLLLRWTVDRFGGSGDFKTFPGVTQMYLGWEEERKEQMQQKPNNQSLYVLPLCSPLCSCSSPSQPLISTHSLVFYHTFLHLNFTNPIYCYLYPWLLLSLLLLSLLLWLESLSSCALFSIFYKV